MIISIAMHFKRSIFKVYIGYAFDRYCHAAIAFLRVDFPPNVLITNAENLVGTLSLEIYMIKRFKL